MRSKTVSTAKTIQRHVYPQSLNLRVGDTFYLLRQGEVWARARLRQVCVYKNIVQLRADEDKHHIARATCDASGPKSYDAFVKAFSCGSCVIFGYGFDDIMFFGTRPRSGQKFVADGMTVTVPEFYDQRYSQRFFTGVVPRLHDQSLEAVSHS